MRVLTGIVLSLCLTAACSGGEQTETKAPASQAKAVAAGESISVEQLKNWQFLGTGSLDIVDGALRMAETDGSVGVTLVSPKSYGKNVVLTFKVKPETYESVNVVVMSASDAASGGDIVVPSDYDGGFGFWTAENVQDYIVAFHNGAHDRLPFILKCPGREAMGEGEVHKAGERWNDVEIGRDDGKVWLKIDGELVVEGNDTAAESLPGGKIGFRLRGTADGLAAAHFKDVVITEK